MRLRFQQYLHSNSIFSNKRITYINKTFITKLIISNKSNQFLIVIFRSEENVFRIKTAVAVAIYIKTYLHHLVASGNNFQEKKILKKN